jgi:D-alanine transaminase
MSEVIVYLNGEFLPKARAAVSVDDRGFLFADGIYEVVRGYRGKLFQIDAHVRRLHDGLEALRINAPESFDLAEIARELLKQSDLENAESTVYCQITRGSASSRAHAFPSPPVEPTIYVVASPFLPLVEKRQTGIATVTVPDVRWARCDLKTIGLLANCLAKQQALESGAGEAIFVRDGVALEGSSSNLFIVKDGAVFTNPKTNYLLPGITRQVVLQLCAGLGIATVEASVHLASLLSADEVFLTHTTGEVMPVVRIDGRDVSRGTPGPVTRRLQTAFAETAMKNEE